jgi:uncharacterized membrane protein YcjF (UPF0283 family)
MPEPQNYKNHGRIVPAYHIGGFLSLFAYFIWSVYHVYESFTLESVMGLLLAVVLIVMFGSVRGQILRVQDRLIRLEMRLRMREVLPADLAARASEIPIKQLVALRFASDAELPELASEVVAGNVTEPKQIKLKIKQWQADHLRA